MSDGDGDVVAEASALTVAELSELKESAEDGALPLARVRASLARGVDRDVVAAAAELVGTLARQEAYRSVLGGQGFCEAITEVLSCEEYGVKALGYAARAVANLTFEFEANRDRFLAADPCTLC